MFIDYVPAEFRENKVWVIEFYVKNPFNENLERQRNRVKPLEKITDRRKLAKQMIVNINNKLQNGWNPFMINNKSHSFAKFSDVSEAYFKKIDIDLNKKAIRPDTYRTFKSLLNGFCTYS